MEIKVTDEQCNLLREALEKYYYICKDDPELRHKLDSINKVDNILLDAKLSK